MVGTFNKKITGLEIRLSDLQNYKNDKISEEKELRTKIKKVDKKLKTLAEKEAEIKIEKTQLKRVFDENKNIKENSVGGPHEFMILPFAITLPSVFFGSL